MHDLVIGALKECGIDSGKGPHAFARQSGSEGHRMLFSNAHIETALGKALAE